MPTVATDGEWRSFLSERLHKLDGTIDTIRSEVSNLHTTSAVSVAELKSRADSMRRVESDLSDLTRTLRDKLEGLPTAKDLIDITVRVRLLEEWKADMAGRLVVWGAIASVVVAVITAVAVKYAGG